MHLLLLTGNLSALAWMKEESSEEKFLWAKCDVEKFISTPRTVLPGRIKTEEPKPSSLPTSRIKPSPIYEPAHLYMAKWVRFFSDSAKCTPEVSQIFETSIEKQIPNESNQKGSGN